MDNSHMLSIIEQKMCADDRNVWARDLEKEEKPATLHALMTWMTVEMKSRIRAIAPIRVGTPNKRIISHLRAGGDDNVQLAWYKSWLCKTSTHWPDQCQKFAVLRIDERIKTAKANHVCFTCLKRAGRDYRMDNCSRSRRYTETENGTQCPHNHHQLLHKTSAIKIGVSMATNKKAAILPILSTNIVSANGLL